MDTRVGRASDCFPRAVDGFEIGVSQHADGGCADILGDEPDRFEITRRSDREASLNDIHPQSFQLPGYLQLFLDIQASPRRLLPIP